MYKWMLGLALLVAVSFGAARAAETGVTIPNRLLTAVKGEWVLYSSQQNYGQKQTITDIEEKDGDKVFTILTELLVDDQVVQKKEDRFSLKAAIAEQEEMLASEGPSLKLSTESEKVKDKDVQVVVVEYTGEGGDVVRSYLSDAIPVTGMLRIEINGEPLMDLKDFGFMSAP